MKTLIYTTVAATAMSGAAVAQQMENTINMTLDEYGFIVDSEALDQDTETLILAEVNAGDPKPETERAIAEILRDAGFTNIDMAGETIWFVAEVDVEPHSLRNLVDIKLSEYTFDVDTAALSDEQVVELYALLAEGEQVEQAEIDVIVNQ